MALSAGIAADNGIVSDADTAATDMKTVDFGSVGEDTSPLSEDFTGDLAVTFTAGSIPVAIPEGVEGLTGTGEIKVTMTLLVDCLVRIRTEGESVSYDLVPAHGTPNVTESDVFTDKDVKTLSDRFKASSVLPFDKSYFRITRAVQAIFKPSWEITPQTGDDGTVTGYEAKLNVTVEEPTIPDTKIQVKTASGETSLYPVADGQVAALTFAPPQGVWKTVDPRYNWISPMLGSVGSAEAYGKDAQNARLAYSSPHWFFFDESPDSARDVFLGESYAATDENAKLVPFKLGLNWDEVRYGTNDTGRLYLPGEIAFLPVPFKDNEWMGNPNGYNQINLDDYYSRVAKPSYFRTLPVTGFEDSAFDGSPWREEDAVKLTRLFRRFAAPGFPEEHRAIMSVFAAQDNYALAQRLRQFAMCGIMPSIREAAAVTRARLETAQSAGRINIENFNEVFPRIEGVTLGKPKYDTFICRYLFPLPGEEASGAGISSSASPEVWPAGARPRDVNFLSDMSEAAGSGTSIADRIVAYNDNGAEGAAEPLGQNDLTTLLSVAGECFGDRQQLFLYILRADSVAAVAGTESLGDYSPLATARAVALVWRDAYGLLPDRVVYYQVLP